jgi:nucleotide-binding universal stress UspA family protein
LKALERAIDLAKKEGAELILLSVSLDLRDVEEIPLHYVDKFKKQATRAVNTGKEPSEKAGLKPEAGVEIGVSLADNIVKYDDEEIKGDLIVIGHQGVAGFGRLLVGSVAARVVADAPCSVLVVR